MPIKRARSKEKNMDHSLFTKFNNEIKPKYRRRLSKKEAKVFYEIESNIGNVLDNIPIKKIPLDSNSKYWDIITKTVPKHLVSKAIKYRRSWKKDFLKAMDRLHESNLYRKR